ncbi:MAG: MBL fold metallo-hydrolase [Flavobacteriales bacterium]|nr:MAG: MBL fold metallo-hydrolase [Flavobacteriales bacterium]
MQGKLTILGSGTSQGVPVIGCDCTVCSSSDQRDKRTRTSALIHINGENHVIDTGPDFRTQMLRENIQSLKSVIFTHEHKDHIAGLDDIRPFNFKEKRSMNVYASNRVQEALLREYHYIFADKKYPGVPNVNLSIIENSKFEIDTGIEIEPIEVLHYKLPVFGFRIGDISYITDAKTISEKEKEKIKGSNILIINALRREPHMSHFNLDEALAFIEEVNPNHAYLTHISHLFGTHNEIEKELPGNVHLAYDGLSLSFKY